MKRIEILSEAQYFEVRIVLSKDCPNYPIKEPFEFMRKFGETFTVDTGTRRIESSVENYDNFDNRGWVIDLRVMWGQRQKLLDFIESFNK